MAVVTTTDILYRFGDSLEKYFDDNSAYINIAVDSWKKALEIRNSFLRINFPIDKKTAVKIKMESISKESIEKEVDFYSTKIQNKDNTYKAPEVKGCYIATCVYGSYDCPEVWTLRRFRDDILNRNYFGKILIKLYYAISPSLVRLMGHKKWFVQFFRHYLDKIVHLLNNKGIIYIEYQDN